MKKLRLRTIALIFVGAVFLIVLVLSGGGGTQSIEITNSESSDSSSSISSSSDFQKRRSSLSSSSQKNVQSSSALDHFRYDGMKRRLPDNFYQHVIALPRIVILERERAASHKLSDDEEARSQRDRRKNFLQDVQDPEHAVLQHGAAGKENNQFWKRKQEELAEKEVLLIAPTVVPQLQPQQQLPQVNHENNNNNNNNNNGLLAEPLDNQFRKNFDPKKMKVHADEGILFMPGYVIEPGIANKEIDRGGLVEASSNHRNNNRAASAAALSNISKFVDLDDFQLLLKRMHTWFYMYSSRIGSPQSITYVVTVCGNSEEITHPQHLEPATPDVFHDENGREFTYDEFVERRKNKNFSDCKHVLNLISSFRGALGHIVIVVSGNSVGDRQWVQVFSEIETNFPGRISIFHRPKYEHKCAAAWNWIARLVFDETTPKADRVLFASPNFHSSRDLISRFGQFQYTTGVYASRFFDPPSVWQKKFGIGLGRRRTRQGKNEIHSNNNNAVGGSLPPRNCPCNAILVSKEGYFQSQSDSNDLISSRVEEKKAADGLPELSNGFREYESDSCDAAEAEFFQRLGKFQDVSDGMSQANTFVVARARRKNDDDEHAEEEERVRIEEDRKKAEITVAQRSIVQSYQGKGIGGGGAGGRSLRDRGYRIDKVEAGGGMSAKLVKNERRGNSWAKGVQVGFGQDGEHLVIQSGDYQKRKFLNDRMNQILPSSFDEVCTCD